MRPQMRLDAAIVAAIPAAIHLDGFNIQFAVASVTRERRVWLQIVEMRQLQFLLMMSHMTIFAKQNQIIGFVRPIIALRNHMMILKTAMIILLRQRRAPTNATSQTIAQIDSETRPIFEAHFWIFTAEARRRRERLKIVSVCVISSTRFLFFSAPLRLCGSIQPKCFCAKSAAPTAASYCGRTMRQCASGQ